MEHFGHVPRETLEKTSMIVSDGRRPFSGEPSSTPTQKRRGRPHGSKNKPKGPVIMNQQETEVGFMKPVILEISPGSDVIHSVMEFACRHRVGLTILSGSGSVVCITIRQPGSTGPPMIIQGLFNILSFTGTYIGFNAPIYASMSSCFGISFSGGDGQVFGGIVGGRVVAGSPVVLVATTYVNPNFHRLLPNFGQSAQEQHVRRGSGSGGGSTSNNEGCSDANLSETSASMPLTSYTGDWRVGSQAHH